MEYAEAVHYLYSLGNEVLTAKLGLHNISALLRFLDDPHKTFRSVLIAGTNGKGSVATFVESVLRNSGIKTGLYTSPHLVQIEERIRVDGSMISAEEFARLTETTKEAVAKLLDPSSHDECQPRLDRHPTYFEMVTAIAFKYFAEQGVELAVLEVGLGGRLDATNVVDPLVAIITNVDYDHQQYLGSRLEEIAFEKAGIIKPRSYQAITPLPVICGSDQPAVRSIVERQCQIVGAQLIPTFSEKEFQAQPDDAGRFQLSLDSVLGSSLDIQIPLPGQHQVHNALLAVRALEVLRSAGVPIDSQNIKNGIESARWPGRLEIIEGEPLLILDGAHNPAGAIEVKKYFERFLRGKRVLMIFGALRDKAIAELGQTLFPLAEEIILTVPESERAMEPAAISEVLPKFQPRYHFTRTVQEALEVAQSRVSPDGVILVVGSLFLIGDVHRALKLPLAAS